MAAKASLAFGLAAAACLLMSAQPRGAFYTRPAAAAQEAQKTAGAQKREAPQGQQPAVQEIDAEGLKRLLLRREGAEARPLLVNFWATWCDPCRDEFPDLVQIDRDYKARGLEFVTVSLDDPEEKMTGVPEFLARMRSSMPAYLLNVPDPEPVIKFIDVEWGGGLPATFLYDARGQLVFKHTGRVKPLELRAAIEKVTGK